MTTPVDPPSPTESVVLCEGYYDRAFWAGLLLRLGCTDPGLGPGQSDRRIVRDPWGDTVKKGQFGFRSISNQFIRVVPCHGAGNIADFARDRLGQLTRRPLLRLILTYDVDFGTF